MKTHSCFTVLKLHMLHLKLMLNKKKNPVKKQFQVKAPDPSSSWIHLHLSFMKGGGGNKRQEKKESRSEQARRAQQL